MLWRKSTFCSAERRSVVGEEEDEKRGENVWRWMKDDGFCLVTAAELLSCAAADVSARFTLPHRQSFGLLVKLCHRWVLFLLNLKRLPGQIIPRCCGKI